MPVRAPLRTRERTQLFRETLPKPWFNHPTARNRRWVEPALRVKHGYQARYPESGLAGVTVEMAARAV